MVGSARLILFLAFSAVVTLTLPTAAQAASLGCADNTRNSTILDGFAAGIISETNAYRATHGLPALKADALLTKTALWKSRDLGGRNYFAHNDPGSGAAPARTPWERLEACGYKVPASTRGENLAAGQTSAKAFVQAWIDSPPHRKNLLKPEFRYIGVGAITSPGSTYSTYATQMFSSHPGGAEAPQQTVGGGDDASGEKDTSTTIPNRGVRSIKKRTKLTSTTARARLVKCGSQSCYRITLKSRLRDTNGKSIRNRLVRYSVANNGKSRIVRRTRTNKNGFATTHIFVPRKSAKTARAVLKSYPRFTARYAGSKNLSAVQRSMKLQVR